LKYKIFLLILITVFFACKTSKPVDDLETYGNIVFRQMNESSLTINSVNINGFMRILGVKDVPPVYLPFEISAKLKDQKASLIISLRKQKILQIIINNDSFIIVNHKEGKYFKDDKENVNFSSVMGLSFDPIQVIYTLFGKIPYSENMELMGIKKNGGSYLIEMSDYSSKYKYTLSHNDMPISGEINNQFYDKIIIESITYALNDNNQNIPKTLTFSNIEGTVKLSFMISGLSNRELSDDFLNLEVLNELLPVDKIEEIAVKM